MKTSCKAAVIVLSIVLILILSGCPLVTFYRLTIVSNYTGVELVVNGTVYEYEQSITLSIREGTRVTLGTQAKRGYVFDYWYIYGSPYDYSSIVFDMHEDTTVQVFFTKLNPASITGQITPYTDTVVSTAIAAEASEQLEVVHGNRSNWEFSEAHYVSGEFVLVVDPSFEMKTITEEIIDRFGGSVTIEEVVETLDRSLKMVLVSADDHYQEWLAELQGVLVVERNYIYTTMTEHQIVMVPDPGVVDDPLFVHQWGLEMINLPKAWDEITTGSQTVVLAVVDTGVRFDHPDLKGIFYDTGWDFMDNDADPTDSVDQVASSELSHGTHVAGTIAALTNNGKGVAGVAWGGSDGVRILPIRVLGYVTDYEAVFRTVQGVVYAVEHGARIINLSLGGTGYSKALHEACKYAYDNDVVIVAAAGNDGREGIRYPARFFETIAVGAVGPSELRAYYSNYGPELDVVAPGGDYLVSPNTIISTSWSRDEGNVYAFMQGTSMATPHVSGVVALLMSQGVSGVENIRSILHASAKDLGTTGFDKEYGWGLVDAYEALRNAGVTSPFEVFVYDVETYDLYTEEADEYGHYEFADIHGRDVIIFAWKDNDMDGDLSTGDLFGYYGYNGGNPLVFDPVIVTTEEGGYYEKDFQFAPIVDTSLKPASQSIDKLALQRIRDAIRNR